MAGRADTCTLDGLYLRTIHDSTSEPQADWDAIQAAVRGHRIELRCPNCRHRLNPRRSVLRTQHFAHWPGESPDCVNRRHEGETDEHREMCDLIAADFEAAGGRAEREWSFAGGRADVAVWSRNGSPKDSPASIAEYERKAETLDEYRHRDAVRLSALARDSSGGWGRRSVIWFARQQHAATYLRLPQLYLSQDGEVVNDGAYHQADLANDDAPPVVMARGEAIAMAVNGAMTRVEGSVYAGDGLYGDAWIVRPGTHAKRGKRRRPNRPTSPKVSMDCARPPLAAGGPLGLGRLPASKPGKCRLCGDRAWMADEDSAVHPCCLRWASEIAAGRSCPSCQSARAGRNPRKYR